MIIRARWVLPIDRAPIDAGWIEIEHGRVTRVGAGHPPGPATDLGDHAILPGLVNAHTHLELSWMAGLVPPADSMDSWIRTLMRVRRDGPTGGDATVLSAMRDAAASMRATGTVLVGDSHRIGFLGSIPLSDAEDELAGRYHVQCRDLLRDLDRIVVRNNEDAGCDVKRRKPRHDVGA